MSRNQTSVPAPRGTVSRVVETTGRIHDTSSHAAATLRLRGVPTPSSSEEITSGSSHTDVSSGPSVRWAPDVVDNEGLGKKQSKVCCIYVKPRAVDESSSSESDSSSSSDDDSGDSDRSGDDERGHGKSPHHDHHHGDENDRCCHHKKHGRPRRKPRPNAYERQPKYHTHKK